MAAVSGSTEAVTTGVLAAMGAVEGAVDAELQRLENLDEEGLGQLREERLQQMQRDAKQVLPCGVVRWEQQSQYMFMGYSVTTGGPKVTESTPR